MNIENDRPKFYKDDDTEVKPDLIPKPDLCITCKKDGQGGKGDILCTLNRMDQKGEQDFKCGAYKLKEQE